MKMKLKKYKKKKNKLNKIIIIVLAIIISIIVAFKFVNKKITPIILNYAEVEAKKIATLVIGKAINNEVVDQISIDDLFIVSNDTDGKTKTIDFNPIIVNKMVGLITSNVQDYLKKLEDGDIQSIGIKNTVTFASKDKLKKGIIYEIPSGLVFNNVIMTNIGPKIPVRLSLLGDVSTNFKTDVTNYGINNALIKLVITVEIKEQVILPFTSKQISVKTEVPLALKLMQGDIPHYYFNGSTMPNVVAED